MVLSQRRKEQGFTIVELLIVIVVIGILAAITIVAYNGIQQRARNTQTVNAVTAWAKAIKMHVADKGSYPVTSCLGASYGYGPDGTGTTGYQCRQADTSAGYTTQSTFTTAMAEYIQGNPTPHMKTLLNSSTDWYRGAYFLATSPPRIDFVLEGNIAECPLPTGMVLTSRAYSSSSGATLCRTNFGS